MADDQGFVAQITSDEISRHWQASLSATGEESDFVQTIAVIPTKRTLSCRLLPAVDGDAVLDLAAKAGLDGCQVQAGALKIPAGQEEFTRDWVQGALRALKSKGLFSDDFEIPTFSEPKRGV